jgi:glycine cleavage system regulatory protein
MATVKELRKGLADTTMPKEKMDALLKGASSLWLSSDSGALLAGDLALCHPPLKRHEVRARTVGGDDTWRLTVATHDRKGLVADTAAILSLQDFSITGASLATWDTFDLALLSLTIDGAVPDEEALDHIGAALRAASDGTRPTIPFAPTGRAFVRHSGSANGDAMISVVAPDQRGLLATICRWFSDAGVNIEAAWITGEEEANDVFVVDGEVNVNELEKLLTHDAHSVQDVVGDMFADARRAGENLVRSVAGFVGGLLKRG